MRVAAYSASSEADRELLTWSLSGADAGSFRIDEPGGVLRFDLPIVSPNLFSPQPDYEAPTDTGANADGTYEVTVEVGDGVTSHSLDVEVTITDQDEAGTLTLSTTRPRQGEIVTATLADPDGVTSGVAWAWERSTGPHHLASPSAGPSRCQLHAERSPTPGHYLRASGDLQRWPRLRQERPGRGAVHAVLTRPAEPRLRSVTTGPARRPVSGVRPGECSTTPWSASRRTQTITPDVVDAADVKYAGGGQRRYSRSSQNAVVELTGLRAARATS